MTETKVYPDKTEFLNLVTNIILEKISKLGISNDEDSLMSICINGRPAERRYVYKGVTLLKTCANEVGFYII